MALGFTWDRTGKIASLQSGDGRRRLDATDSDLNIVRPGRVQ